MAQAPEAAGKMSALLQQDFVFGSLAQDTVLAPYLLVLSRNMHQVSIEAEMPLKGLLASQMRATVNQGNLSVFVVTSTEPLKQGQGPVWNDSNSMAMPIFPCKCQVTKLHAVVIKINSAQQACFGFLAIDQTCCRQLTIAVQT